MRNEDRPAVSINGEYITHGEVESLRVAVTNFHSEMSDPLALGDDEHGRFMTKHYFRNMERILRLMGVIE
jgi:hypothetical protein